MTEVEVMNQVSPGAVPLSSEKNGPWLVVTGYLLGMKFPTQLCEDYFISHEIRIPLFKQPFMESIRPGFLTVAQLYMV